MNDDDKLTRILEELSELKNEMKHLTQRVDNKSDEIRGLDKIIPEIKGEISQVKNEMTHLNQQTGEIATHVEDLKTRVRTVELNLALNDQKTNKMDKWAVTILSCIVTIMLGFIAFKLGLK